MTDHKYAFQGYNKELHVRSVGRSLPISVKVSVEICNFLRKRPLQEAKRILERVLEEKQAIPYRKFNKDVGHKPGKMAAGRYPKKASTEILNVMKNAEANAQMKGFNTNNLQIIHMCAHKGSRPWHHGRQRRQLMKRTHVEVVVAEMAVKEKEAKPEVKKEVKEEKPVEKKVEEKKLSEGKQEVSQETKKSKTSAVAKTSVKEVKPKTEPKPKAEKVEEKPKEEAKPKPKAEVKKEEPKAEKKPEPKKEPKEEKSE